MKKSFLNEEKINSLVLMSVLIFIVFINFVYFYLNFSSNIEVDSYAFNELFINYQAGFIRRGLLGEIFWQLNNSLLIKPTTFFSLFFLIIYLLQILFLYFILKNYLKSKLFLILIFFSPALLLFHIYSPDLYFLKDGIIKFSILLHAFIFHKFVILEKNNPRYLKYLKFLIVPILFFVILTHEYQVFYLGIHLLTSLSLIKNNGSLKRILIIYLPLILPFLLIVIFFGDPLQFENLTQILKKFDVNLNSHLGGGILKYLGAFYKWHFFYFSYRDFVNLIMSILLTVGLFYFLFQYLIDNKILSFRSKFQAKYILFFVPCIIPFFLTTDHGRNLSFLSFYLIAFYSTLNLNLSKFMILDNKIVNSISSKLLLIIFIFFYIFMWKLNQFAGFGLQGKPNDIFQSSLFGEIIKCVKFMYSYIDSNIVNLPELRL
jgi:hypothetical protein